MCISQFRFIPGWEPHVPQIPASQNCLRAPPHALSHHHREPKTNERGRVREGYAQPTLSQFKPLLTSTHSFESIRNSTRDSLRICRRSDLRKTSLSTTTWSVGDLNIVILFLIWSISYLLSCLLKERIYREVMTLMQRILHRRESRWPSLRWHFLKKGMEHIFTKLEEGLTYTKYMDLYTYFPPLWSRWWSLASFTTFAHTTRWLEKYNHIPEPWWTDNREVVLVIPYCLFIYSHFTGYPIPDLIHLLIVGAYLMGQDLYKYLIIYLNEYLKTLRKVSSPLISADD
jgi:hypothetical protein